MSVSALGYGIVCEAVWNQSFKIDEDIGFRNCFKRQCGGGVSLAQTSFSDLDLLIVLLLPLEFSWYGN